MFRMLRSILYAIPFVSFWFVAMPYWVLAGSVTTPASGAMQATGVAVALAGVVLAGWCIAAFVFVGKGTQAPFDPPRNLVVRGPYTIVRNPMYEGGVLVIAGTAIYFASFWLMAYALAFLALTHVFVVAYEEPTLRRMFDGEYDRYCAEVSRWLPARAFFPGT